MENKTELINTIIDCVNDSIDLDSNKVSLGVLITLLNDNIPEQFYLQGVSQQRELLPKTLSSKAYKCANSMSYEGFLDWWELHS